MRNFFAILLHKFWVSWYLFKTCIALTKRAWKHDFSKLGKDERHIFNKYTHLLRGLTYGSDEYKQALSDMKPALDHHYAVNRHHPEFYEDFISMSPIDRIEMLCDWKAATRRHKNGDLKTSIEINAKRFGYSDKQRDGFIRDSKEIGLL